MYVSRFCFHSIPGKTDAVKQELKRLANMVARAGGKNIRYTAYPLRLAG